MIFRRSPKEQKVVWYQKAGRIEKMQLKTHIEEKQDCFTE